MFRIVQSDSILSETSSWGGEPVLPLGQRQATSLSRKSQKGFGVSYLQVKDLRRHYAITLAEAGADMHDIQQALGYSGVPTTEK